MSHMGGNPLHRNAAVYLCRGKIEASLPFKFEAAYAQPKRHVGCLETPAKKVRKAGSDVVLYGSASIFWISIERR